MSDRAAPGPLDSPPPSVNVEVEFGARSRRGPLRSGQRRPLPDHAPGEAPGNAHDEPPRRRDAATLRRVRVRDGRRRRDGQRRRSRQPARHLHARRTWRSTSASGTSGSTNRSPKKSWTAPNGSTGASIPRCSRRTIQPGQTADDADGRLHRRHRAVLRARGTLARLPVSRRRADAADARPQARIAATRSRKQSGNSAPARRLTSNALACWTATPSCCAQTASPTSCPTRASRMRCGCMPPPRIGAVRW